MALILNIETATDVCSVALANNGKLVGLHENFEGREHSALLTVFIEKLLRQTETTISAIDAIAVSMGPGSYTGLRIGVSAAKGICYATDKPLIAVQTLQAMSRGFIKNFSLDESNAWFCPMIDARRLEVYTAFFNGKSEFESEISAQIINETSFLDTLEEKRVYFFGDGSEKCSEIIRHPHAIFTSGFKPSAQNMIELAQEAYQKDEFKDVAYFEPFYLKDFVATTAKNKIFK